MLKVTVWSSTVLAATAGPEGDAWFSDYLGRPVRLVYLDDPTRRPVDPEYGRHGDVVSFADGYPLLLTSTASLDELGRWLTEDGEPPVPMTRFRPNAVVPEPRPGPKTAGAASASAPSSSASSSPAGGASSPPPTRSPASRLAAAQDARPPPPVRAAARLRPEHDSRRPQA